MVSARSFASLTWIAESHSQSARSRCSARARRCRRLRLGSRPRGPSRESAFHQVQLLCRAIPFPKHVLNAGPCIPLPTTPSSGSVFLRRFDGHIRACRYEFSAPCCSWHRRGIELLGIRRYPQMVDTDGNGCRCRAELWRVIRYGSERQGEHLMSLASVVASQPVIIAR